MGARSLALPGSRSSPRRRRSRQFLPRVEQVRKTSTTRAKSAYVWLPIVLTVLVLRQRLFPFLFRPRGFPGTPASTFRNPEHPRPLPSGYYNVGAKFFFYTSEYGQFNNQVVSLLNALFIARRGDAVLVLPFAKLGKESKWDLEMAGLDPDMEIPRELVGDYFNYSRLLRTENVVRPTEFFASADFRELLALRNVTVNFRSGNAYRKLFTRVAVEIAHRKKLRLKIQSPPHEKIPIYNYCDFSPNSAMATVAERGRNGRFTFLPIVFRRHNLNCTFEEPHWVSIRRSLVPRDEFLRAVDRFYATLDRPVLALHLRIFLNGDTENFTPRSFVDMLFRDFGRELMRARTLFMAYSPSSDSSRAAFEMLKERFHGDVVDGSRISTFFRKGEEKFASLAFSNVLLDMWTCVRSDMFLGRLGSSLSWNTVFWRQALRKEYGLNARNVAHPLWYALSNFSTNGAAERNEGPLLGSNLAHY